MRPIFRLFGFVASFAVFTPVQAAEPARGLDLSAPANSTPLYAANTGTPSYNSPTATDPVFALLEKPSPSKRFYGGAEYLLWWVKSAPLSVPMISSGSTDFKEGFLINSSAVILYGAPYSPALGGNNSQSFPASSGTRATLGYWLDDAQKFAIEGSGFLLYRQTTNFSVNSDPNGGYPDHSTTRGMRVPVYNTKPYAPGGSSDPETGQTLVPIGEDGVPLAIPGDIAGGASVENKLKFWGLDASGIVSLYRDSSWDVAGLVGFRYLNLSESLNLSTHLSGIPSSELYKGQSGMTSDTFGTQNQFYGANFGVKGRFSQGPFSVDLAGRLALGVSHEVENVVGYYRARNSPFGLAGPEGIFAQPANEGTTSSDHFAVVPEARIKLGYAFTPWLRATVGYDFIYFSNVIRPGDQMSRGVPKGQTFQQDGTAPSATSPSRLFKTSNFYAQGLNFGLELSF